MKETNTKTTRGGFAVLLGVVLTAGAVCVFADASKWIKFEETDPATDSRSVWIELSATERNARGDPFQLSIRCKEKENELDLYVNWNLPNRWFDSTTVTTRIGDGKATSEGWLGGTVGNYSYHPRPLAFIKELMTADQLLVQRGTTELTEGSATATFDTTGLTEAIKPVQELCGRTDEPGRVRRFLEWLGGWLQQVGGWFQQVGDLLQRLGDLLQRAGGLL